MAWTFGELKSWGNLTGTPGTDYIAFSGTGAITPVRTGWHSGFRPRFVNPLVLAGGPYPVDTAGHSSMPFEGGSAPLTYIFSLVAPASYADDDAFNYLRAQYETLLNFVLGTYTLDGVSGTTGQKGWLVARDERASASTLYKAKARVLEGPGYDLIAGLPHQLIVSLTWGLTSSFTAYTP